MFDPVQTSSPNPIKACIMVGCVLPPSGQTLECTDTRVIRAELAARRGGGRGVPRLFFTLQLSYKDDVFIWVCIWECVI